MRKTVRYEDEGWQLILENPAIYLRHFCSKVLDQGETPTSAVILRYGYCLDMPCGFCNKPAPEGIRGLYTMIMWGVEEGCNF